jgi:hypothetical protein
VQRVHHEPGLGDLQFASLRPPVSRAVQVSHLRDSNDDLAEAAEDA